jgi:predicted nuclease of predicted toxin-antitoxin system
VKLREFGLLTDENVDREVVDHLRQSGFDVKDVYEQGWRGSSDAALLSVAVTERRVIVTHDADFGPLVIHGGLPLVGILYLRPGHIDSQFTIATVET